MLSAIGRGLIVGFNGEIRHADGEGVDSEAGDTIH